MNDAASVSEGDGLANSGENVKQAHEAEGRLVPVLVGVRGRTQDPPQTATTHFLHGEPGSSSIVDAKLMHGTNTRMLKLSLDSSFGDKASDVL